MVTPPVKREAARLLMDAHTISIRRAYRLVRLSRSTHYTQRVDRVARDRPIVDVLQAIIEHNPRAGFWKCQDRIERAGHGWNHKRVWRVYCEQKLNQVRRTRKRVEKRLRQPLEQPEDWGKVWALDFVHDTLQNGRCFRALTVIDEANREALCIEPAFSLPAQRVVRLLDQLSELYGKPLSIRCDNGPEFLSQHFVDWCRMHQINILYTQPGKPTQNAFIERFNGSYRREVLDVYLFENLDDVRDATDTWLQDYNTLRGHDALMKLTPEEYRLSFLTPEILL
jgi:putative transposase